MLLLFYFKECKIFSALRAKAMLVLWICNPLQKMLPSTGYGNKHQIFKPRKPKKCHNILIYNIATNYIVLFVLGHIFNCIRWGQGKSSPKGYYVDISHKVLIQNWLSVLAIFHYLISSFFHSNVTQFSATFFRYQVVTILRRSNFSKYNEFKFDRSM